RPRQQPCARPCAPGAATGPFLFTIGERRLRRSRRPPMNSAPDLVIFDCDGVLVDSEPIFNRAHADILSQCGYRITPRSIGDRFCGISDAEMLAAIEREWGRPLPADYTERVAALTDASCATELATFPGIREALDHIQARICVASSSTPERVRKSLAIVGLLDR